MSDRFENKPVRSWTIESVYDLCSVVPFENTLDWRIPEGMPTIVADRIKRLADDQFDEGACEANCCAACLPMASGNPSGDPAPVGFHLSGDNDQYMSWKWTCVVLVPADDTRPEQAIVVCEDCDPTTLYIHQAVKA